jgi:hypothetical protein
VFQASFNSAAGKSCVFITWWLLTLHSIAAAGGFIVYISLPSNQPQKRRRTAEGLNKMREKKGQLSFFFFSEEPRPLPPPSFVLFN